MSFSNKFLPTRTGRPTGDANERQMVAQFDTNGIRTGIRLNADGSKTMVRTHGGLVRYYTTDADNVDATTSAASDRGFGAIVSLIVDEVKSLYVDTLISWTGTAWSRVKQLSQYVVTKGYAVIPGVRKPNGVNHLGVGYHDVAVVKGRNLTVNTQNIATFSAEYADSLPIVYPVVVGEENTYPSTGDDASVFHTFAVLQNKIGHFRGVDTAPSGEFSMTTGAQFPPSANVLTTTFDVDRSSGKLSFWEQGYTVTSSTYLNLYYRYAAVTLEKTPPYVTATTPVVVPRQFYVYVDMSDGASVGSSTSASWDNAFTVPDLPLFDFYTARVGAASNGNPDYYNTYFQFESAVSGPSVSRDGSSTTTRTFSNTVSHPALVPVTDSLQLEINASQSVNYTLVNGVGALNQIYEGGGPNYEVLNVPADSFGSAPGKKPFSDAYIGLTLQITASGTKKTYDNSAETSVSHILNGRPLFQFNSSLTFNDTTTTGWAGTGRGSVGRGVVDGQLWAENIPNTIPGNKDSKEAFYALGWTFFLPDVGTDYIRYCAFDSSTPGDAAALSTESRNSHTFSMSRTSSAYSRDYIFDDAENGVSIYIAGTFTASNTTLGVDGFATLKVELVVVFNGVERKIVIHNSSQSTGCNVLPQTTPYVMYADFDPTHIPMPSCPSFYVPRCEQGDFKYIAYSTADEHSVGCEPRLILSLPLYLARREQLPDTYPHGTENAYIFRPFNLEECSAMFANGCFLGTDGLSAKVFHVTVSHEGVGDWMLNLDVPGTASDHYAECYRT